MPAKKNKMRLDASRQAIDPAKAGSFFIGTTPEPVRQWQRPAVTSGNPSRVRLYRPESLIEQRRRSARLCGRPARQDA